MKDYINYERNIDDIVATLKSAKRRGKKCTILVGAGCSVSAGIPAAKGIVEDIRKEFFAQWERAVAFDSVSKSYSSCMEQLAPEERRNLISKYIEKAGINWAHICIAQLIREKYVDRVLTTNFDPLVLESCALLGFTPAVYDITSYPNKKVFKPSAIPDRAVFYLHAPYWGFNLINTTEEGKKNIPNLTPFFNDSLEGRPWIVIGYSGDNDPVFKMLSRVSCFNNNLYWICHSSEPNEDVKKMLLKEKKYAFYVPNMDADAFFIELTQDLKCFPEVTTKPFSHLKGLLKKIKTYKLQQKEENLTKYALELIDKAIKDYEVDEFTRNRDIEDNLPELMYAKKLLSEGKYQQLIGLLDDDILKESDEWKKIKADAFFFLGNSFLRTSTQFKGKDKDEYLNEALELFNNAISLNPNFAEALFNKGHIFWEKSYYSNSEEREQLITDAKKMFDNAYQKNPKLLDALVNLGKLIYDETLMQDEKKQEKLFTEAIKYFDKALKINRWDILSLYNKGLSLLRIAFLKDGEEKRDLLLKVILIMDEILKIDSRNSNAFEHKGLAYAILAENTDNKEKQMISLKKAIDFLKTSIDLDNNNLMSYENLGKIYSSNKDLLSKEDTRKFYDNAKKVYDNALSRDPLSLQAMNGKGLILLDEAKDDKEEKDTLIKQAIELFSNIEKIETGRGGYNLACSYALLEKEEECKKWLEISKENNKLPKKSHILKDDDLKNYIEKEWFKAFIQSIK